MSINNEVNRRAFLKNTGAIGATFGLAGSALAGKPARMASGRVIGANDRINVGVIGVGGRGTYVANAFAKVGAGESNAKVVAVCDVYQKRVNKNKEAPQVRWLSRLPRDSRIARTSTP